MDNEFKIPKDHCYCSYCGKVKPSKEFRVLLNEEFCMCNKCYTRKEQINYIARLVPILFSLILIGIFLFLWNIEALITTLLAWVFYVPLFHLILRFIITSIIKYTPLRVSLSSNRKKWLYKLKDTEGNTIINPIIRSKEEEDYYKIANVYLDRDIPYNHFRCPCCGNLHLKSNARSLECEDNNSKMGGRLIGGTYTQVTTIEYKTLICPSCFWYKKFDSYIKWGIPLISLILSFLLGFFYWKWDSLKYVIALFCCLFFGGFLGLYLSFVYKQIVYLVSKKELFISFSNAVENGSIIPKYNFNKE